MWILVIYGVLKLIQDIVELIEIKKILNGEVEVIVKVFNQEENILGIIQKLAKEKAITSIKVEDAGSYDDTYKILLDLEKEYKNLYVMKM